MDVPFADWIAGEAKWFREVADEDVDSHTPRLHWLAGKLERLAEQARYLGADSPEEFEEKLRADLDEALTDIRASRPHRCEQVP